MSEWINVKDRLPENEQNVLVCCEYLQLGGNKNRYVCEAYHINHHSVEQGPYWNDDLDYYYDEEEDKFYVPEGWYEVIHNWDEYGSVVIYNNVIYWMEMPQPPQEEE